MMAMAMMKRDWNWTVRRERERESHKRWGRRRRKTQTLTGWNPADAATATKEGAVVDNAEENHRLNSSRSTTTTCLSVCCHHHPHHYHQLRHYHKDSVKNSTSDPKWPSTLQLKQKLQKQQQQLRRRRTQLAPFATAEAAENQQHLSNSISSNSSFRISRRLFWIELKKLTTPDCLLFLFFSSSLPVQCLIFSHQHHHHSFFPLLWRWCCWC